MTRKRFFRGILIILILFFCLGIVLIFKTPLSPALFVQKVEEAFSKKQYWKVIHLSKNHIHSKNTAIRKEALFFLGKAHLQPSYFFYNPTKAEKAWQQAADLNHKQAAYSLALQYDTGNNIPEDKEKAIHYMQQAAKNNYPPALHALGVWIERGYLTGNYKQLYEKAAEMGYRPAITSLIAITGGQEQQHWIEKLNQRREE